MVWKRSLLSYWLVSTPNENVPPSHRDWTIWPERDRLSALTAPSASIQEYEGEIGPGSAEFESQGGEELLLRQAEQSFLAFELHDLDPERDVVFQGDGQAFLQGYCPFAGSVCRHARQHDEQQQDEEQLFHAFSAFVFLRSPASGLLFSWRSIQPSSRWMTRSE